MPLPPSLISGITTVCGMTARHMGHSALDSGQNSILASKLTPIRGGGKAALELLVPRVSHFKYGDELSPLLFMNWPWLTHEMPLIFSTNMNPLRKPCTLMQKASARRWTSENASRWFIGHEAHNTRSLMKLIHLIGCVSRQPIGIGMSCHIWRNEQVIVPFVKLGVAVGKRHRAGIAMIDGRPVVSA
jgi:hypothetical protein